MTIKFVYGFLPAIVQYVDALPDGFAGRANAIYIKILLGYKEDRGILEHELVHVKQCYRTFFMHGLIYRLSKSYRLSSEAEAYATQLKINKIDGKEDYTDFYAKRITEIYDLNVTFNEAKQKILEFEA